MMSDFYVSVPEKVAGDLIIRSTLNRCGLALNSGLWDSGFKGNLGAIIYNRTSGQFRLMPHTRVCQLKFIMSDSSGMYAGGYNREMGKHWLDTSGSIYDLNAVAKMTGSSGPL
jgi:deoxycytidine triphosphate deaminase